MIKLQDLTPSIYYDQSRDFQFIGRLYDIVLNYIKTSADSIYNLPCGKNMDERLLNLLALTLGFQSKHHYSTKHLEAVCSILPTILRKKGSLQAVFDAVNAMLYSEGIKDTLDYYIEPKQYITLYLPQQLTDLSLIKDLLPYILPAGMGCNLVKEIKETIPAETVLTNIDEVSIYEAAANDHILQLADKNNEDWQYLVHNVNTPSADFFKHFMVDLETFGVPKYDGEQITIGTNSIRALDHFWIYINNTTATEATAYKAKLVAAGFAVDATITPEVEEGSTQTIFGYSKAKDTKDNYYVKLESLSATNYLLEAWIAEIPVAPAEEEENNTTENDSTEEGGE